MQIVQRSRRDNKITGLEIIHQIMPDFMELHGDRLGSDDPAIVGGIATFNGHPVTVITTDRGKTASEKVAKHFGSPMPGGYRKALRLIQQAGKFKRPVICLVNTPGAFPSQEAEEQGQGAAIAQSIIEMGQTPVPIITIIYGEGGSGGALALAAGDEVWMLEHSTYSVLSPEGFASILWKDSSRAAEAAEVMQMTPEALLKQQIIDGIIPENQDHLITGQQVARMLTRELTKLNTLSTAQLLQQRQARYRKF
ncbi:carboxyltransferase subunit alpha [Limosilactobacillus caecicola]|uniref:carboxyltransferase subunit alpha n=1 Tax=Limosilactobacillus caecicola TaxID=2941332 RepID=UPI00203DB051|nr:carboxyltransferase subunit alpha [Limosilactobacillus caecicola]